MPRLTPPRRTAAPPRAKRLADRPTRWQLILRRNRRFARPAAIGGAGLAGLVAVAAILHAAHPADTLDSTRQRFGRLVGLRVRQVVIEGRANTPEPLLRAAIGVSPGDPIFGFSVEEVRQRLSHSPQLSWIDEVVVERRLPGTVLVSLTEKRPFAIWQNQGRFQLIDRSGATVNEDVGAFRSLPLVVGLGAPARAAEMLDLLAKQPGLQSRVAAIVRVDERRWNLHLANGTDVLLPEGVEAAALDRLAELQAGQDLLDRPLAAIDLRLPDRLVIRPQPDHGAAPATPPKRST